MYEDVDEQLKMVRQYAKETNEAKDELQSELQTASAYIVELEEKFYKAQRTSLDLLKELKQVEIRIEEQENEIETLRTYIVDLKSRIAVYIPVKND